MVHARLFVTFDLVSGMGGPRFVGSGVPRFVGNHARFRKYVHCIYKVSMQNRHSVCYAPPLASTFLARQFVTFDLVSEVGGGGHDLLAVLVAFRVM
jgi:hypothetical protein